MVPHLGVLHRAFIRLWRRSRRRLLGTRGTPIRFVYHPRYSRSLSGLPHDGQRADRILAFLFEEGLADPKEVSAPHPVNARILRGAHTDEYLDTLHSPDVLSNILGAPVAEHEVDEVLELQRLIAGGTIQAAELAAMSDVIGVNLGGGFHHARPDRGHGFCVLNDLVMAVQHLRGSGFLGRVMIIDLDLHDGDGTRIGFAQDSSVHTFSIHNQTWSDAPAIEATTLALGTEIDDTRYLAAITKALPAAIEAFDPELVIYIAGADPAIDDRIGDWKITPNGMLERDRRVVAWVGTRALAILLGGGYGTESWRYSARFLGTLLAGRRLEPPGTTEQTLGRLRELAHRLDPRELSGQTDELGLSEEDLADALGLGRPRQRFLDFYTRHGIELALERLGLFERLRRLGFSAPTLVVELDHRRESGDLLKIFGDRAMTELLVEIRLRRDALTVPAAELLAIEWLLLQNPRQKFTEHRRRLPGQAFPGLGLLDEVVSVLVLVTERLQLDGLLFVPAHYHTAAQALGRMRFLRAEDRANFAVIREAAQGRPLDQVSWALEQGELRGKDGQLLTWRPSPMVVPLSDELKERLGAEG